MNKLLIALFVFVSLGSHAQNSTEQRISIDKAIEIGLQNRNDTKANKLSVDIADNTIAKRRKEWLPNITGTANVKYNTQLQEMVADGFGGGGTGGSNTITLGTKNQSTFSLDLTQNLFKPGIQTDIQIAREEAILEQEKNVEKEIDIKFKVTETYLNTILKDLLLKLASSATERYARYLKIAEDRFELGALTESDVVKARLDYENAKLAQLEAKQNYDLTITQLKYNTNIREDQPIILTDSLETLKNKYLETDPKLTELIRTEIKQLRIQSGIYNLQLRKGKQYFLPTISLFANYTTQFQGEDFNYSQQMYWSPYNNVGIKLVLPITGNLNNRSTIKESELKLEQNRFQLLQKQSDLTYEMEKNRTELLNTFTIVQSSKNNLNLSKKVFDVKYATYRVGKEMYNTILDTEASLRTAEQNYVKAVFNYLVATLNYHKSMGTL